MNIYKIEVGEDASETSCHCCDEHSQTGHGFVYKNDEAYAVYYAAWSNAHQTGSVSFALAIGEWGDNSTTEDRVCYGFEVSPTDSNLQFRILDPVESPWPNTDLLGPMLTREYSLKNPNFQEVYLIAESIIYEYHAIKAYLEVEG